MKFMIFLMMSQQRIQWAVLNGFEAADAAHTKEYILFHCFPKSADID